MSKISKTERLLRGGTDPGFVRLPSQKNVPKSQYGFHRYPSSGGAGEAHGGPIGSAFSKDLYSPLASRRPPHMADGGAVMRNIPQNPWLGKLARLAKYIDESALAPTQRALGRIPLGFSGGASEYTSGEREGLAGLLVPRLGGLGQVLEEASYGMPHYLTDALIRRAEEIEPGVYNRLSLNLPKEIKQIQGKANKEVLEKYRPYVRDLLESEQWGNVANLEQVGLKRAEEAFQPRHLERLKQMGHNVPRFMTEEEAQKYAIPLLEQERPALQAESIRRREMGFAKGGEVAKMPKLLKSERITSGEAIDFPTLKEAEPILSLLPKQRYVDSLSKYVGYSPDAELLRRVPQMADGGEVLRAPPQNKFLGALSRLAKTIDERALAPTQRALGRIPLGFTGGASEYTSGEREGLAGMLVPRLGALGQVLEEASYGMPLTTGRGMTTGIKPEVGMATLEASQVVPAAQAAGAGTRALGRAAREQLPGMAARLAERYPLAAAPVSPMYAVKPQGGQWMPGSSAKFVDPLRAPFAPTSEVRKWAEKKIPQYIEKYMGATGDPLADVRIPHGRGLKRWEEVTDPIVSEVPAGKAISPEWTDPSLVPDWMRKLPSETPIYSTTTPPGPYGSSSVQDYMSRVLEHAEDIPPEKLKQYDFPRLVKEFEKKQAERINREAKARLSESKALPIHKAYPEGYKWVDISAPKEGLTPQHMERVKKVQEPVEITGNDLKLMDKETADEIWVKWTGNEEYYNKPLDKFIRDKYPDIAKKFGSKTEYHAVDDEGKLIKGDEQGSAFEAKGDTPEEAFTAGRLIEEGNVMGHCVGGYCPDVMKGEKRILSLRDPKGESHATVEINQPSIKPAIGDVKPAALTSVVSEEEAKRIQREYYQGHSSMLFKYFLQKKYPGLLEKMTEKMPPNIAQIKGKQNKAIKEDYIPYVKDLLKSQPWGEVKDLHNVGLAPAGGPSGYFRDPEIAALKQMGADVSPYISPEERIALQKQLIDAGFYKEGMKKGGTVKTCSKGCDCLDCKKMGSMPNNLLKLRMLRDFGPTFARGGPVKKTVDIKEQSHSYPIVRHIFQGDTASEALHYLNAHKKSDDFMRDCLAKGKYKDVPCSARRYADGGSISQPTMARYLRNVSLHPEAEAALPAVSFVESRHNPRAIGPQTRYGRALGQYQMLPTTARDLGVNPMDPMQARAGAHRYLSWLITQTGSLEGATAAYNMGLGNYKKLGSNPKNWPKETQSYVDKIRVLMAKEKAGQQPTLASAPINPGDASPQPDPKFIDKATEAPTDLTAPSGPSTATSTIGGVGPAPRFQGYNKLSGPMRGSISSGNPMDMVSTILKDPMSFALGED